MHFWRTQHSPFIDIAEVAELEISRLKFYRINWPRKNIRSPDALDPTAPYCGCDNLSTCIVSANLLPVRRPQQISGATPHRDLAASTLINLHPRLKLAISSIDRARIFQPKGQGRNETAVCLSRFI
jgi:hypothetical protein